MKHNVVTLDGVWFKAVAATDTDCTGCALKGKKSECRSIQNLIGCNACERDDNTLAIYKHHYRLGVKND
tara:strand:+ start:328 stop:534 length:207 start_codon:yes stop_codon:yes gene_type:complete